MTAPDILQEIKRRVAAVDPTAQVVLYGSYARGEQGPGSDIDLLILLDREKLGYDDRKLFTSPLYRLEFATGVIISPMVLTRSDWHQRHHISPFYHEVQKQGIVL